MIFFQKIKSIQNRYLFYKYELYFKVLKIIFIFLVKKGFNFLLSSKIYSQMFKKKNQIHNFCLVSSRSSSILRKYKVSRHAFRFLNSFGFFFGLRKASW